MFGKKRPESVASDHILQTVRCISEAFYNELVWARHFLSAWKIWSVGLFFAGFLLGIYAKDLDGITLPSWVFYMLYGGLMVALPAGLAWMVLRKKEEK